MGSLCICPSGVGCVVVLMDPWRPVLLPLLTVAQRILLLVKNWCRSTNCR